MPLTKKQQLRISQLVTDVVEELLVRRVDGPVCHVETPAMQTALKYVNELLKRAVMKERKVHLPERGRGRDYDRYVE